MIDEKYFNSRKISRGKNRGTGQIINSIVVSCYVLAVSRNGNTFDWTLITGLKVYILPTFSVCIVGVVCPYSIFNFIQVIVDSFEMEMMYTVRDDSKIT